MKLFLVLTIFASSCGNLLSNEEVVTPTPVVVAGATCESAYKHLNNLCQQNPLTNSECCETIEPSKTNVSFVSLCKELHSEGIDLNLGCLNGVTSCSQINVCTDSE